MYKTYQMIFRKPNQCPSYISCPEEEIERHTAFYRTTRFDVLVACVSTRSRGVFLKGIKTEDYIREQLEGEMREFYNVNKRKSK